MNSNIDVVRSITGRPWLVNERETEVLAMVLKNAINGTAMPEGESPLAKTRCKYLDFKIISSDKKMKEYNGYSLYGESSSDDEHEPIIEKGIAIIDISGMITYKPAPWWFGNTTSTMELINTLTALGENPMVTGVLLTVDSGGGEVQGLLELSSLIYDYKRKYGKRVEAMVECAASAAYWIISGCDKIWANSNLSSVGSIGVMTTFTNTKAMYKAFGIEMTDIYASLSTEKNLPTREAEKGNFEPIKMLALDPINLEFIKTVNKGRFANTYDPNTFSPESTPDVFTGRMFFAEDAKDKKMIDGISPLKKVLDTFEAKANAADMPTENPAPTPEPIHIFTARKSAVQILPTITN